MKRAWLAALAACAAACAEAPLSPGAHKKGIVVEVETTAQGEQAARAQAQKLAVAELFDLYLDSAALAAQTNLLEMRILSRAGEFVPRSNVVSEANEGGLLREKVRVLVGYEKLGHELDGLGVIRPEGVAGSPRIALSIEGPSGAAEAVRHSLMERGYVVIEENGAKAAAGAAVSGTAEVGPSQDARLEGYRPYRAVVELKAEGVPGGERLAELSQQATAVDVSSAGAAARALSDAGELAAARLRQALAARYRERTEMSVLFAGFGTLEKARRLLADLRVDPSIVAAAFDSFSGGDLKLRLFIERASADELAAKLSKLKGYSLSVRFVEPDYHYVEMEGGRGAF